MPTATIDVRFVNQPRQPGGKFGSVKDAAGDYWSVPVAMLGQFTVNGSATVEYDTTQKGDVTYKNIKKLIVGVSAPARAPSAPGYRQALDPLEAEKIAVLALVKPWIEKIEVGDTEALAHAIRSAREAWRQAYTKQPSKIETGRPDDDMNDGIPF